MPELGDAVAVAALFGLLALAAAGGIVLLTQRSPTLVAGGVVVIVLAGLFPLVLGYAFGVGVIGVVAGGALAAIWRGWSRGWVTRALLAGAVVFLAAEPVVGLAASVSSADERFSRCAADRAIGIVEASRAAGTGYPATMADIAQSDPGPYHGPCYVSSGVNWLYRVSLGGSYVVGYWVDWHVARDVCLYSSKTKLWSCGFEQWGPFRPGERD